MVDEQQDEISVAAEPPVVRTPPADPPSPETGTRYVVLSMHGASPTYGGPEVTWLVVAPNLTARSPQDAVTTYAEKTKDFAKQEGGLILVAVPERSWKPLKVTPKVTTTLTVEEAK